MLQGAHCLKSMTSTDTLGQRWDSTQRLDTSHGGLFAVESEIDSILSEMILLLGSEKSRDVIRACLNSFPAAKVPILHATMEKFQFSTLKNIMDEILTSVSSPDDNGNYAFHIALIKGMPWSEGLQEILYAYPSAAEKEIFLTQKCFLLLLWQHFIRMQVLRVCIC